MCHVLIVLTSLKGLGLKNAKPADLGENPAYQQTQENLIAAYVSFLRLAGLEELIPLYCSRLAGASVYHILSHNLIHITEHEDRLLQLNLIRKAGLDPLTFVRQQPTLLFEDLVGEDLPWPAVGAFKIMTDGPPSIKYGRPVKTDFFGEDPDMIDRVDERLIRSVEWLVLVDGAWSDAFSVGSKIYKHFLSKPMPLVRCRDSD